MPKVLLVEDEELIRTMVKINLEREGFSVECFRDAESALEALGRGYFDVVLLDIMLPGMPGDEALAEIRRRGIQAPVIMMTAKRDVESKVGSFERGADDYMTKPFDMEEMLARVKAMIRRSQAAKVIPSNRLLSIAGFEVNLESRVARTREGDTVLTEKEVQLLALFASRAGKTLSRADILEEVWGMDVSPTPRTIDNFIVRFRKLFEENPEGPAHFITVRAAGYRYEA